MNYGGNPNSSRPVLFKDEGREPIENSASNQKIDYTKYLNNPNVNKEKLNEFISLGIDKPRNIKEAKLLAEAVGIPEHRASVVAAQWALESAHGKKVGGDYNYFGIKSHNKTVRDRMSAYGIEVSPNSSKSTKEEINGKLENIDSSFLNFNNPIEAFIGYKAFIETNPRYSNALNSSTSSEYAYELKKAGYATDSKYLPKLKTLVDKVGDTTGWKNSVENSNKPVNPSKSVFTVDAKDSHKKMMKSLNNWKAKQNNFIDPDKFDDSHNVSINKKENPKGLDDLYLKPSKRVDFGKLPEFQY